MAPNSLARYQRPTLQLSTAPPPPERSLLQHFADSDILTVLLQNPEQAYSRYARPSTPREGSSNRLKLRTARGRPIVQDSEDEAEYDSKTMLAHLKATPKAKVSQAGRRQRGNAKDRKADESKCKKHTMLQRNQSKERSPKVQKVDVKDVTANMKPEKLREAANTKKKVDDRLALKGPLEREVIDLCGDSDTGPEPEPEGKEKDKGPPLSSPKWSFLGIKVDDDNKPSSSHDTSDLIPTDQESHDRIRIKELEAQIEYLNLEHNADVTRIKHEKEREGNDKARKIQQDMQKQIDELKDEYRRKEEGAVTERSRITLELFTIKTRCDRLHTELAAEKEKTQTLTEQNKQLSAQLELEKVSRSNEATVRDENSTLKTQLKEEKAAHEELMRSLDTRDSEQIRALQTTNSELIKELAALKNAKRSDSPTTSTNSSSTTNTTDEQTRIDNVRKTYIKVKRRYDNLHSVAINLSTATRGMDLSCFGEFGGYMRQLRGMLEEKDESGGSGGGGSQSDTGVVLAWPGDQAVGNMRI